MQLLSVIVPVLNEEEAIPLFLDCVLPILSSIPDLETEIIFVDDGSTDGTVAVVEAAHQKNPGIALLQLSRNFGKEAAMTAGLEAAAGDAVICIDVDMQDPPELIADFVAHWRAGYDVVLGRRVNRDVDSVAKRKTASIFYSTFNMLSSIDITSNAGDFRLMSRRVVDDILRLPERNRFMKGIFAWVGYDPLEVEYSRAARSAGTSKFNGWKLWNFALEGITSFSTVPLRVWSYLGGIIAVLAILYTAIIILRTLVFGVDVPGYASIMVVMLLLGAIQLISLGVVGEYVGRIYIETKARPLYLVRRRFGGHTVQRPGQAARSAPKRDVKTEPVDVK